MLTFLSRANKGPLSPTRCAKIYRTIVETTKSEAHAPRRRRLSGPPAPRGAANEPAAAGRRRPPRHPLSTPSGRMRATLRERPTASTTPTTPATSL